MATTAERLEEARDALHKLVTGTKRVQVRDANGRQVTYSEANRKDLDAYISGLEANLGTGAGRYRAVAVRF